MRVERKRSRYATLFHDRKADGVREREVVIVEPREPVFNGRVFQIRARGDNDCRWVPDGSHERQRVDQAGAMHEEHVRLGKHQVRGDEPGAGAQGFLDGGGDDSVVGMVRNYQRVPR